MTRLLGEFCPFQILTALEDIHSHDVVHCDLKPGNIMVFNSVYKWKLIDFDSATIRGEGAQIHATPAYAAPEIIEAACTGEKEIAVETFADMWSFGIIAFEMLKGTLSFYVSSMHRLASFSCRDAFLWSLSVAGGCA